MAKKKAPKKRKSKVPKTRNANTWTESQFWSFIRSALRAKSRWWIPILNAKKASRRAYNGANKRQKWEYECNSCKNWFSDKEVSVDHIKPVGKLTCGQDLPDFVENLFCTEDNLQVLCKNCHDLKTKEDRNGR